MSDEDMRALVEEVIQGSPQLILDLLARQHSATAAPDQRQSSSPRWCLCDNCIEMTRDSDKVCCGYLPEKCLSRSAEFQLLCLDRMVIAISLRQTADTFAYTMPDDNHTARYAAHRQFAYWRQGRLGEGRFKDIPSCCVAAIRTRYPDPNGQYTDLTVRGGQVVRWVQDDVMIYENAFCIIGPLWGESTGDPWIPLTKGQ